MSDGYQNGVRRGGPKDRARRSQWDEGERLDKLRETQAMLRMEPHNDTAEAALLGALLIDNRLVETCGRIVRTEDFYLPLHARIYHQIRTMVTRGKPATAMTLRTYFEGDVTSLMDDAGKPMDVNEWLLRISSSGAALIGAKGFARQIRDLATLRSLIDVGKDIITAATDPEISMSPTDVMQGAEAALMAITAGEGTDPAAKSVGIGESWDEAFAEINAAAEGKPPTGIDIHGYEDWNDVVGRMDPGSLILLGARPSVGKTAVGVTVAFGAAMAGNATEFLSIEQPRLQITRRMIANRIFVQGQTSSYEALIKGRITPADRVAIANAREEIDGYPLHIADPNNMKVEEVLPFIRRRQRYWRDAGKEMALLVLDHLSRLGTMKDFRSPAERMTHISRTLKTAAKETGVPIIALAQLSRGVTQREDKHPVLADLRDSGSLEEDADVVAFIHRDEYYLKQSEPSTSDHKKYDEWQNEMIAVRDRMELYAGKRREGALIKKTGYFFSSYQAIRSSSYYREDGFGGFGGRQTGFEM